MAFSRRLSTRITRAARASRAQSSFLKPAPDFGDDEKAKAEFEEKIKNKLDIANAHAFTAMARLQRKTAAVTAPHSSSSVPLSSPFFFFFFFLLFFCIDFLMHFSSFSTSYIHVQQWCTGAVCVVLVFACVVSSVVARFRARD